MTTWRHCLRAQLIAPTAPVSRENVDSDDDDEEAPPSSFSVARYILDFLTLDMIGESGIAPTIDYYEQIDSDLATVYWNYDFPLADIVAFVENILPEQVAPEVAGTVTTIGWICYDDQLLTPRPE